MESGRDDLNEHHHLLPISLALPSFHKWHIHEWLTLELPIMKTLAVFSAFLSLLATASATSESKTSLDSTFKPPQVFKNANLVHVVSVEKNYVKENINVLIENIDKAPQNEYYLPFTGDQMSRVGGFEVKDRKDAALGAFKVEAVEFDPER